MHIPASSYADRSLEFPPRNNPLILLVDTSSLCQNLLEHIRTNFLTEDIVKVLEDTPDEALWLSPESIIPREAIVQNTPYPLDIQPQLWKASPLIEQLCSPTLWKEWIESRWRPGKIPPCIRILDAGCGTGRNAIYTVQELLNSSRCTLSSTSTNQFPLFICGIDNRRAMIEKAVKFVQRKNMESFIQFIQYDIDKYYRQFRTTNSSLISPSATEKNEPSIVTAVGNTLPPSTPTSPLLPFPYSEQYSLFFFIRFTHKAAIAQSIYLMNPYYGGFIIIDGFHTSTPHPSDRESQLEEGETKSLLETEIQLYDQSQEKNATIFSSSTAAYSRTYWSVQVVHEKRALSEDNRPMLHVIVQLIPSSNVQ